MIYAIEKLIFDDNQLTTIYRSVAEGGQVQYNLFLHDFKAKKIIDDKYQKDYIQNYLASRKTPGPKDKLVKRELTFQPGNAVAFVDIRQQLILN